ncbi:MAG: hypothetical protein Ta2F_06820 [Termitinemataceae bacterium]|nr:MAG: hypothetical protein Ta2F_06820 [Termitinemataceae bacterium]
MLNTITEIITKIPSGAIFDSHTIIEYLLMNNSDKYLSCFSGATTESYHGQIGKIIDGFNGVSIDHIGKSWSKNIHQNFSDCTCWKKK